MYAVVVRAIDEKQAITRAGELAERVQVVAQIAQFRWIVRLDPGLELAGNRFSIGFFEGTLNKIMTTPDHWLIWWNRNEVSE